MKHIFDLDNTLVYTDEANACAYNAALEKENLKPLRAETRITKETVLKAYPDLTQTQMLRIIANKKALYPVHKTFLNKRLLRYAKEQGKDNCILWSCGDPDRIFSILDYHRMQETLSQVFFSKKNDVWMELGELMERYMLLPEDVIVYEDTDSYIKTLREHGIAVVDVKMDLVKIISLQE